MWSCTQLSTSDAARSQQQPIDRQFSPAVGPRLPRLCTIPEGSKSSHSTTCPHETYATCPVSLWQVAAKVRKADLTRARLCGCCSCQAVKHSESDEANPWTESMDWLRCWANSSPGSCGHVCDGALSQGHTVSSSSECSILGAPFPRSSNAATVSDKLLLDCDRILFDNTRFLS